MSEPAWRQLNRANWDERVALHLAAPSTYDLTALRSGQARLDPIVTTMLGPVVDQRVLHLQCHFGMDSLMLAQAGARVTGVDFSAPAIETAQGLAAELGLADRARFVLADVYDAASALDAAQFDRVLVSWGALCWLPDISAWARVVAACLRPGGWLALAEAHPAAYVFDDRAATPDGLPGWYAPYFARTPLVETNTVDYANPDATLSNATTHEFLHPLSDVVTALLQAGLRLDALQEHDAVCWRMFGCLVQGHDRQWRWPDRPWLPLAFSLRASKPVGPR